MVRRPGGAVKRSDGLGIFRASGPSCWSDTTREAAFAHFDNGGDAPLMTKADRISTVHRRVPLDLAILPVREDGEIVALSVHAGLWTSAAIPLLALMPSFLGSTIAGAVLGVLAVKLLEQADMVELRA